MATLIQLLSNVFSAIGNDIKILYQKPDLGTTSTTAYRGDYGQVAYNHSTSVHAPIDAQKNSDILKAEIEAKLTGEISSHSHLINNYFNLTETTPTNTTRLNFEANLFATSGNFADINTKRINEEYNVLADDNINLSLASLFQKTISTNTTFTISNIPTNKFTSFILELINGGSYSITWFSSNIKWDNGTSPTLTSSGKDILLFYTIDNGSTWNGIVLAKDIK